VADYACENGGPVLSKATIQLFKPVGTWPGRERWEEVTKQKGKGTKARDDNGDDVKEAGDEMGPEIEQAPDRDSKYREDAAHTPRP